MDLANLQPRPGDAITVTVTRTVNRASARKTLERLFMSDRQFRAPIDARAANHYDRPKRRGGRDYVKYARKVHPEITPGTSARVAATAQHVRDLQSVAAFVEVK